MDETGLVVASQGETRVAALAKPLPSNATSQVIFSSLGLAECDWEIAFSGVNISQDLRCIDYHCALFHSFASPPAPEWATLSDLPDHSPNVTSLVAFFGCV